ncbi:hypothetical protein GCM10009862_15610 [Microbacterium binotii]|uniref:Antitoxin n=1 Tax=Microbacterium binotii TaxID=462710 RepID=A0ABN3PBB6_9MICO
MGDVPNKPGTPVRAVRVADDIWLPAKAKAKSEGVFLPEIIRAGLEEYIEDFDYEAWLAEHPEEADDPQT